MDRNTVIGLVLIGLIFSVFTIFNKPSEEEIKAEQELIAKAEAKEKAAGDKAKREADRKTVDLADNWKLKLDEKGNAVMDNSGSPVYTDTITGADTVFVASTPSTVDSSESPQDSKTKSATKGKSIRMETDKLIIDFNTKGGQIASVRLKEFESYNNYAKEDGEIDPLTLFKAGDASNGLSFPYAGGELNTENEIFSVKSKTKNAITFQLKKGKKGVIEFVYNLSDGQYDLDFDINVRGFSGQVNPKNVMFNWDVAMRKTERLFSEQRRVSTVCYNYEDEGFSYLSEVSSDEEVAEDDIDWICYKQSFFSSFIKPENSFKKSGSSFEIDAYGKESDREWSHLKGYSSTLNLNLNNVDNSSVRLNWFFGPNDYTTLTSYDSDYDLVLNYGWGIFRWINIYAIQPIFKLLKSTGVSMGIVILILTLLIKSLLMPIQWKMYTSSAKMRILKPEIDAVAAKFPNKEDAMKKNMEVMSLQRESGASPLSGCVPMIIQMPILLAMFRFFPATFDLRQKSFLWAEDLSSYDSIWDFGTYIWPYGDHVSLFTLLMAGTTLIYTVINSSNMQAQQQPGMPNMKYIMYFFPVMMIFFFNNYSSGLSYYYFISTLMSILIMIMIKRFFVDEDKIKAKMAERKVVAANGGSKKTGGKSKFQERLEKMQKAQLDQAKNRKK